MADNETIADIIAQKRKYADEIERKAQEYIARSERVPGAYQSGIVYNIRSEADRLEAAYRRERGNAAKLREALVSVQKKIHYLIGTLNVPNSLVANRMEINGIINAALAEPVKNCEVGTAMEQGKRFSAYCQAHKHPESECLNCPLLFQTGGYCELAWAQLPYEEGGDK